MKPEGRYNCFVVNNAEELLSALKKKVPQILIAGSYKKKFLDNTSLPLTEKERMGFELGFRGLAGLVSSPVFHLINFFSKGSKQQKRIDSKIRKYTIKKQDGDILLYLRQLDY